MRPEDGCLWVYGVGEDGVPAFTRDGMEYYSRSSPTKELPTAHHRRSTRPNDPACAFHRMLTGAQSEAGHFLGLRDTDRGLHSAARLPQYRFSRISPRMRCISASYDVNSPRTP